LKTGFNYKYFIKQLNIAEYLRSNKNYTRELLYNSHEIEKLKNLSIIHTRMTQNRARHINKLHFAVRQYFPLHEALFGDFGCTVQLKMLIKYPAFADLNNASDKEIDEFLKANRYRRPDYIDRALQKIRKYNQLISGDVEFACKIEAESLCELLFIINNKLKEIEFEMNKITDSNSLGGVFKSLPGAGNVPACKLLGLFGDNKERFDDYNGIQCLFGTAPKNYQSGMYHKVIMRKA
jgi:hypothetical protein